MRFVTANMVGGLVNVGLYSTLVRFAPPPVNNPFLALAVGTLAGLVFNFTLSSKLVFKGPI
jgi:putative flippase GtrA